MKSSFNVEIDKAIIKQTASEKKEKYCYIE